MIPHEMWAVRYNMSDNCRAKIDTAKIIFLTDKQNLGKF